MNLMGTILERLAFPMLHRPEEAAKEVADSGQVAVELTFPETDS
jgi:hypothetical protein